MGDGEGRATWVGARRFRLLAGGSLALFLVLWEVLPRFVFSGALRLAVPPLSEVVRELGRLSASGVLYRDALLSATRVLVGFLLASAVGIPAGILLGVSPTVRSVFSPYVAIIRPLPSVSWIPIAMMVVGIGEWQKYAIIFMGSLAPILVATLEATVSVDATLIRAARNLGAGPRQVMFRVLLPAALPQILAGLKVALAVAWTCIISAELVAASSGFGARLWNAKDYSNYAQIAVAMAGIVVTVMLFDRAFDLLARRLLPWRRA